MPAPSRTSQIVLGLSLTVAVALIIVVATSRPSDTGQVSQSLLRDADTDTDADTTAVSPSMQPSTAAVDGAAVDGAAVDGQGDSTGAEPETQVADATQAGTQTTATPAKEGSPSETGKSSLDPATDTPRVSEATQMSPAGGDERALPAKPPASPEENAGNGNAGDENAGDEGASGAGPEQAGGDSSKKPAVGPGSKTPEAGPVGALKRLSLEFARRAAARGREQAKATPVAPPAEKVFAPTVVMSDAHRKSCVVFVGDSMPDGTLPDGKDEEHTILKSLGERLTVIVFWSADHPYALDQFEELQRDLVPFGKLGVQTIAIHVGPQPENYSQLCEEFGSNVVCLLDSEKAYFQQVSSGSVPRTFLLDETGRITWLDIEYSRTTRYDLHNALHYSLRDEEAEAAKADVPAAKADAAKAQEGRGPKEPSPKKRPAAEAASKKKAEPQAGTL